MDLDLLLIQKMKLGDEQAVDAFVKKYYLKILNYCCLHIHDYGYAEDAAQETFEQFFRTLNHYKHYGKALNYLYVIAANKCKNFYAKKKELVMENLPEQLDYSMDNLGECMDIHHALEDLPLELREIAILFFFQQLKQKEIAQILGIGLPLVKYRVRKAKELLILYLGEEETL